MRGLVLAGALCCLLSLPVVAQRVSIRGGFHPPAQQVPAFGIPPVGPIPPLGTTTPTAVPGERGFGRYGRGFGYGFPGYFAAYDGGGYGYQASPGVVIVMPPPSQPVAPPPEPAQPVLHDYAKSNAQELTAGVPTEFAIVGTDHMTHPAIAVWAQGGMLHYIEPGGAAAQMPLGAVDREATEHANAARGLRLQVPLP
jgi:hypothetical protein